VSINICPVPHAIRHLGDESCSNQLHNGTDFKREKIHTKDKKKQLQSKQIKKCRATSQKAGKRQWPKGSKIQGFEAEDPLWVQVGRVLDRLRNVAAAARLKSASRANSKPYG